MEKFADKIIALLIFAIMVPVGGALLSGSTQPTCYPVPSLLLPAFADSWSYYFNTTNNRWYNASSTNGYVTSDLYNEQHHATDSSIINRFEGTDVKIMGVTDASYLGKNVTQITMKLSRYVDGIEPTGNIIIGIFQNNSHTYTTRQAFATIDVSTLTEYGIGFDTYVANHTSGYTMQAGDIIGLKADAGMGHVGTRSGVVSRVDDTTTDYSFYDDNNNDGPFIHGGFAVNGNYYGTARQSTLSNSTTYTIIPLSGHTPAMTSEGRMQCNQSFTILWIIFIMAMISVITMLLVKKKGEKK